MTSLGCLAISGTGRCEKLDIPLKAGYLFHAVAVWLFRAADSNRARSQTLPEYVD